MQTSSSTLVDFPHLLLLLFGLLTTRVWSLLFSWWCVIWCLKNLSQASKRSFQDPARLIFQHDRSAHRVQRAGGLPTAVSLKSLVRFRQFYIHQKSTRFFSIGHPLTRKNHLSLRSYHHFLFYIQISWSDISFFHHIFLLFWPSGYSIARKPRFFF